MIAIARYLVGAHVRTRRFVTPGALLAGGVVLIYAPSPNPVLPTAGMVAAFLFFAQIWLAHVFFASASAADRHTLLAAGGPMRLTGGHLLAGAGMTVVSTLLAVAYPIAAQRFEHMPHAGELAVCLLATLATALAATALAAMFAPPLIPNRALAAFALTATARLTIPAGAPSVATARALDAPCAAEALANLGLDLGATAGLAIAIVVVCPVVWRRSE